ncbi:MAG: hypothetical protein IKY12_02855 [Clostridia bacterium]|nr:hypothetical protein [Clostridia bacterium]
MRKLFTTIAIILIFAAAVYAFITADKNAKDVADFLQSGTLFSYEDKALTILNEKIKLR